MSAPRPDGPTVLGIETSCDETAAAVLGPGRAVLSSVVSSQIDLHARFGGVVPELAGRAHVELLTPVVAEALARAGADGHPPVDAVAVTCGPGLVGSLLVGLSHAKALSVAWDVPFVGVNHLEGHLFASLLDHPELEWPLVVLLVSGGHTVLEMCIRDRSGRRQAVRRTRVAAAAVIGTGLGTAYVLQRSLAKRWRAGADELTAAGLSMPSDIEHHFVTTGDGGRIHVVEAGEGPTIVLLSLIHI